MSAPPPMDGEGNPRPDAAGPGDVERLHDGEKPGDLVHARDWVLTGDLRPGDAYRDGPYVVFTGQFHLRRGSCCNSGCRHCPYKAPALRG